MINRYESCLHWKQSSVFRFEVCGFSFFGNLSGVNGVGMVDAAVLPFGFLGQQDILAWGFSLPKFIQL